MVTWLSHGDWRRMKAAEAAEKKAANAPYYLGGKHPEESKYTGIPGLVIQVPCQNGNTGTYQAVKHLRSRKHGTCTCFACHEQIIPAEWYYYVKRYKRHYCKQCAREV